MVNRVGISSIIYTCGVFQMSDELVEALGIFMALIVVIFFSIIVYIGGIK